MLQLSLMIAGFMFSQSIAQGIRASIHNRPLLAWCSGVLAQYATCVAILVFIGNESLGESLSAGLMLIWLIRTIYLMKNLPKT